MINTQITFLIALYFDFATVMFYLAIWFFCYISANDM